TFSILLRSRIGREKNRPPAVRGAMDSLLRQRSVDRCAAAPPTAARRCGGGPAARRGRAGCRGGNRAAAARGSGGGGGPRATPGSTGRRGAATRRRRRAAAGRTPRLPTSRRRRGRGPGPGRITRALALADVSELVARRFDHLARRRTRELAAVPETVTHRP